MVAETFTYKGQRIADEVFDRFGDVGAVQINTSMMLRWINDGVRAVVAQNPFLKSTATTHLVAGQSVYSFATAFPSAKVVQFDTIVVLGTPIEFLPFADFRRRITAPDGVPSPGGRPTIGTVYGDALTLWPTPSTSEPNGITIYFSAYPDDITDLNSLLPVPDRFYNALRDYVFAQALELDNNFEAAAAKMHQHQQGLEREYLREERSPAEFYPVSRDPDIDWYDADSGGWM